MKHKSKSLKLIIDNLFRGLTSGYPICCVINFCILDYSNVDGDHAVNSGCFNKNCEFVHCPKCVKIKHALLM